MNVLMNGTAIPEPASLTSEWVTVAGVVLRQVTLHYDFVSAANAALVLGPGTALAGVNLTFLDPKTNANATLALLVYTASVVAVLDRSGTIAYVPLTLTLREVPPAP